MSGGDGRWARRDAEGQGAAMEAMAASWQWEGREEEHVGGRRILPEAAHRKLIGLVPAMNSFAKCFAK